MKYVCLTIILFSISSRLFSQFTYEGPETGQSLRSVITSTDDIIQSSSVLEKPFIIFHKAETNEYLMQNSERVKRSVKPQFDQQIIDTIEAREEGINIVNKFEGIENDKNVSSPDPYIAVGLNHIIQITNFRIRITDKSGKFIKQINAFDWFSEVNPEDNFVYDPKILFDHFDNRWIMVWLQADWSNNISNIFLSVSDDENPIGEWYNWKMAGNLNGNTPTDNWSDYQGVGFDDKAVYIVPNQVSWGWQMRYSKLRIIRKSEIYNDGDIKEINYIDFWNFNFPDADHPAIGSRPAIMWTKAEDYYLVDHARVHPANHFAVIKVKNVLTDPVLEGKSYEVEEYEAPPLSVQPGDDSPLFITRGYYLCDEPKFRDGFLHATHMVNGNPTSVRYLCFNMNEAQLHKDISFGVNEVSSSHSAISINSNNDALITYPSSSPEIFRGAYFTIIPFNSGIPSNSVEIEAGKASYKAHSNSQNKTRWGDYMGATTDPVNQDIFWLMTEYVKSSSEWGHVVAAVSLDKPNSIISENSSISVPFKLYDNYPNPFNPSTKIKFEVSQRAHVSLVVANLLGETISILFDKSVNRGEHELYFNGEGLSSGIYYYTITVDRGDSRFIETKKMALAK